MLQWQHECIDKNQCWPLLPLDARRVLAWTRQARCAGVVHGATYPWAVFDMGRNGGIGMDTAQVSSLTPITGPRCSFF